MLSKTSLAPKRHRLHAVHLFQISTLDVSCQTALYRLVESGLFHLHHLKNVLASVMWGKWRLPVTTHKERESAVRMTEPGRNNTMWKGNRFNGQQCRLWGFHYTLDTPAYLSSKGLGKINSCLPILKAFKRKTTFKNVQNKNNTLNNATNYFDILMFAC